MTTYLYVFIVFLILLLSLGIFFNIIFLIKIFSYFNINKRKLIDQAVTEYKISSSNEQCSSDCVTDNFSEFDDYTSSNSGGV